jgi:DNA-binding NarL/FixJ family response regulator
MTETPTLGIMVVDDNALFGEAIERWALRQPGLKWLGWTDDGIAAPAIIAERNPDLVLLDVDMPGFDTFGLIRRLAERVPSVKVVMLSGHVRADYIDRAASAGAMGYIVKDEAPGDIFALAARAVEGEFVLSQTARAIINRRSEA